MELVKNKQLFSDLSSYVSGDFDAGLFVISGKLNDGVDVKTAENAIEIELEKLKSTLVSEDELQKCKNKVESSITFSETDVLTKATNLAISELLGDANEINKEIDKYNLVTREQLKTLANTLFDKKNCSTLYYLKK
jgi:predicted Zn-dependent peptidase